MAQVLYQCHDRPRLSILGIVPDDDDPSHHQISPRPLSDRLTSSARFGRLRALESCRRQCRLRRCSPIPSLPRCLLQRPSRYLIPEPAQASRCTCTPAALHAPEALQRAPHPKQSCRGLVGRNPYSRLLCDSNSQLLVLVNSAAFQTPVPTPPRSRPLPHKTPTLPVRRPIEHELQVLCPP
jgi:hypothetical protein